MAFLHMHAASVVVVVVALVRVVYRRYALPSESIISFRPGANRIGSPERIACLLY